MKTGRHFGLSRSERHAALDESYPACNDGPCRQGRTICPSPQACQRPELDVRRNVGPLLLLVSVAIVVAIGVALVRYFIGVNA